MLYRAINEIERILASQSEIGSKQHFSTFDSRRHISIDIIQHDEVIGQRLYFFLDSELLVVFLLNACSSYEGDQVLDVYFRDCAFASVILLVLSLVFERHELHVVSCRFFEFPGELLREDCLCFLVGCIDLLFVDH